jgi:hypothetical protein
MISGLVLICSLGTPFSAMAVSLADILRANDEIGKTYDGVRRASLSEESCVVSISTLQKNLVTLTSLKPDQLHLRDGMGGQKIARDIA